MGRLKKISMFLLLFVTLTGSNPDINASQAPAKMPFFSTVMIPNLSVYALNFPYMYELTQKLASFYLRKPLWEIESSQTSKLYVGIDNYLILKNRKNIPEHFQVVTDNGYIFKEGTKYILIPSEKGAVELSIITVNKNDTSILNTVSFPADYLPKPSLTINGHAVKNNSLIYKQLLMQGDSIGVCITNDLKKMNKCYTVKNFEFGCIYGNHYISYINDGVKFNSRTKRMIRMLMPAQSICVRVKYRNESNMIIKGKPYRFLITI